MSGILQCYAASACCLPPQVACLDRRFALPALLPLITPDLHLTEQQGALLTAGYAVSAPSCAIGFALSVLHELHFALCNHTCSVVTSAFWQASVREFCAWSLRHCMFPLQICLSECAASEAGLVAVAVRCSPDSHRAACRQSEPATPAGRRAGNVEPPHHDWLQGNTT